MAIGSTQRKKSPLGVFAMLVALVLAAFFGAAAGLVWQGADWFSDEPEDEVITTQTAES
ncbi:MAG: hypothetical protein WBA68_09520 [Alteraurantiacibacter sp.]